MAKKRLGDVLRERGMISEQDLYGAIAEQQGKVRRLGEVLLERGLVSKDDLVSALVDVTRIEYVDCQTVEPEAEALRLIPKGVALRHGVLPLHLRDGGMVVAMAEPQNVQIIDELRFLTGKHIFPLFCFRPEIEEAVERIYGNLEAPKTESDTSRAAAAETGDGPEMEFFTTSSRQSQREAMMEFQAEMRNQRTPAVRLVSVIIAAAVDKKASDIHIEPQAKDTFVRIRVDGVLRDLRRVPRNIQNSLISRIKILADMDIAERRAPQDGSLLVQLSGRKLDLRVSTLPTHYGEKVVIRLLEATASTQGFEDMGLSATMTDQLKHVLSLPQGMLLVTGPTGSGKSTTLYGALNHIKSPGINIVTVEDPVEYMVEGVNQVQVNVKAGVTFASVLRSILRQDPNVIMVGEIRDRETAEIALKASQTGHLVLSTLHTNDSISAVTRLLDLDIPGFMIASSVSAVLAQRLVRKLCNCHEQVPMNARFAKRLEAAGLTDYGDTMYVAVGCDTCDQTGYRGRVGIYELLIFDEHIRSQVRSSGRPDEIRAAARGNGFRLMQEDALEKVRTGMTTLDEVLRVVPLEKMTFHHCARCGHEMHSAFLFCPYCGLGKREAQSEKLQLAVT